jgi:drug/metabolite transporter (DMT)-like permease
VLPASLATIYVVWGSTYLAIRVMVETMPPLLAAGARFTLAGGIFWLVLRLSRGGRERVRATGREITGAAVVGTLLCFGGNGLVTVAEQHVPSGLAALILGSIPLWVVVLRVVYRERVPTATLAGVLLGFVGLAILVLPSDRPGGAPLWGLLTCIAAAALWAAGTFSATRIQLPSHPLTATAWQMLLGGAGMLVVGMAVGEVGDVHPSRFSGDSLLAFAYLVVIGSLLAFSAYTWLLRNAPVSLVATYAYVNPVIAVFLGWAILDEQITLTIVAGALAIVASVATVVRREAAERAAA